jgi:guanylate kinase
MSFAPAEDVLSIEYVSPSHGYTEKSPYRLSGPVTLTTSGRAPHGPIDAPAYVFRNIFGLTGLRILLDPLPAIALAGGMESSNFLYAGCVMGASMLCGADLSQADIFALATKLENDEFGAYTGGQGTLNAFLGGAYRHIWLGQTRDADGRPRHQMEALSVPLATGRRLLDLEAKMMFVQPGRRYESGRAVEDRLARILDHVWSSLLADRDNQAVALLQDNLELMTMFARCMGHGDVDGLVKIINRYVDIRDALTRRWVDLMLDAHTGRPVLPYAQSYARHVFDPADTLYSHYKPVLDLYQNAGEQALREASIYLPAQTAQLIQAARAEGMSLVPLASGGPGGTLMAISPRGTASLRSFLQSQGLSEIPEAAAASVVSGTGDLKGFVPFHFGRDPLVIEGFRRMGMNLPEGPRPVSFDETIGQWALHPRAGRGARARRPRVSSLEQLRSLAPQPPRIVALIGPSGAGKSTLAGRLTQDHADEFVRIRHVATRPPSRRGESSTRYFLSRKQFNREASSGKIVAVEPENHGVLYGIALEDLSSAVLSCRTLVLESDLNVTELLEIWPGTDLCRVAILPAPIKWPVGPEDRQALRAAILRRIKGREETLSQAAAQARIEEGIADIDRVLRVADVKIVNSDGGAEDAYQKFECAALAVARPRLVRANDAEIVRELHYGWDARIQESRPFWRAHPGIPVAYNAHSPSIAYDPTAIPNQPAGAFLRLTLPDLPDDARSVTREDRIDRWNASHLLGTLKSRFLVAHPEDSRFAVVCNFWPKVRYDCSLISTTRQPQRLTPEAIRAEFQWVRRGMVAEFEHPHSFVDHLHIHLYPASTAPIARFGTTFQSEDKANGVMLGTLDYPIRHIAVASSDAAALESAVWSLAEQLEREGRPFSQNALGVPGGEQLIVCFVLWGRDFLPFGFNTSGFLKVPEVRLQNREVLEKLSGGFADAEAYAKVRACFLSS